MAPPMATSPSAGTVLSPIHRRRRRAGGARGEPLLLRDLEIARLDDDAHHLAADVAVAPRCEALLEAQPAIVRGGLDRDVGGRHTHLLGEHALSVGHPLRAR